MSEECQRYNCRLAKLPAVKKQVIIMLPLLPGSGLKFPLLFRGSMIRLQGHGHREEKATQIYKRLT